MLNTHDRSHLTALPQNEFSGMKIHPSGTAPSPSASSLWPQQQQQQHQIGGRPGAEGLITSAPERMQPSETGKQASCGISQQ
ncbi:unnamed protein product [Gongylonema pulchrum]|uniref:Uncharacterized protein n=1 Tax=Gongylonema pulchrum TaxID=637853 RepID=A0A183DVY5_9BILA|nr:unnamed protein product [Gongylonema pulchrum]